MPAKTALSATPVSAGRDNRFPTADAWPQLFERMALIRALEEKLATLFADGEIPGFIHLSIGQEAVPVGVSAALQPSDTVASNHRGHGHAIAKGLNPDRFFLEIMGREEGYCRGRGGSMHIADVSAGMLGANGIVGGGIPLAVGSALAHRIKGEGNVAACYFGDGALAEGNLHESLNMTALWSLPLLFVCEDNGWGEFSRTAEQFVGDPIAIARAFGLETMDVDGNDVIAVAEAANVLIAGMRKGGGPAFLRCRTERVRGHFEGDSQKYKATAPQSERVFEDPLCVLERNICAALGDAEPIAGLRQKAIDHIERAVAVARAGTHPDFADAFNGVYTR